VLVGVLLVALVAGAYWLKTRPAPPGSVEATQGGLMKAGLDALYTRNDAAAAAEHFKKVLALNPAHYGATFQLAMALDRSGKPAEARPFWEKALKMAEGYNDTRTAEAARERLARPDTARDEVARAATMKAGLDALYLQKNPVAAAVEFRKVLALNPTHYGATFQLAMALDRAGKPKEARPLWETVARMAEGYKDTRVLRIVGATPPYSSWSLNADIVWHFNDVNPRHYDLLNVRYVVAPRRWPPPAFLRPLQETSRYVLYQAPGRGYGELAAVARTASPPTQAALFFQNRNWFSSPEAAAGAFVRYAYPPGRGSARAAEADTDARARCPGGRVTDERIGPGRLEMRTECASPATLVLKTSYHPNWRLTVDGRPAPTFMVSPSFIGVTLPPGAHRVRAEYRSGTLKAVLLVVGAVTLRAVLVFRRRLARVEGLWARGD
jgi:Tfp pilus assembly protein PilF